MQYNIIRAATARDNAGRTRRAAEVAARLAEALRRMREPEHGVAFVGWGFGLPAPANRLEWLHEFIDQTGSLAT